MPLQPESKLRNLEGSLNAWVQTHLVTAEGLTVHFPHVQHFTPPSLWVRVDYLWDIQSAFGRQIGAADLGARVMGLINLNCCERVEGRTTLYGLSGLVDQVVPYFQAGQVIPLRDFTTGGTPVIGGIDLEGMTQALVDTGQTSGVTVYNCTVIMRYLRRYNLVV